MEMPTQSRLIELFEYNEETGVFVRKTSPSFRVKIGDTAGSVRQHGYVVIGVDGIQYYAHRLAWIFVYGEVSDIQIDHIDNDMGNNAIKNLREVTQIENHRNQVIRKNNTSGVLGVFLNKRSKSKKWCAQITINGKTIGLGAFFTKEEATEARSKANIKYGYHKNHGTKKTNRMQH